MTGQSVIVQGGRGLNVWPFCRPAGAQIAPALCKYTIVYLGYTGAKGGIGANLYGFFVIFCPSLTAVDNTT